MSNLGKKIKAMGTSLTKKKNASETEDWVIGSLTSIGEIGVEISEIDITTLDSPDGAKEYMQGDIDAGECSIAGTIKKEDDETTVTKMMALIAAGTTESWEVKFPSGAKWAFNAFVKSFKTTEETTDGLIGFSGSLRISGMPVYTKSTVGV
ncbi:MAG: hypothetical protein HFJ45_02615 [Clostridia bacterium]|nr:hypothetical protein [Clostridia bacterium]